MKANIADFTWTEPKYMGHSLPEVYYANITYDMFRQLGRVPSADIDYCLQKSWITGPIGGTET